jgi:hypothetical protein
MKENTWVFKVLAWPEERDQIGAAIRNYNKNLKVITLDVKEILKGKDPHNDILNEDIAKLIKFCLKQIE